MTVPVGVYLLVLQLTLSGIPVWLPVWALAAGLLVGLLVVALDGTTRRTAARKAGWPGDPDLLAVAQVDAAHGVLPSTEPERELAYRFAVRAWSRRWSLWTGTALVLLVVGGTLAAVVAIGGWSGSLGSLVLLVFPAFLLHQSLVVLPRLRRIVREVEGSHHPGRRRSA